ncbi:MAG: serine hydrolase, partial [Gemmatimonadota bacterium]
RTIEAIRAEAGVPGVALAIVAGDSVVHARGFGVREIGRSAPVGPNTLFAIGSATKAFTATLVGTLVDEGRLHWDDRVVDRLPGFSLKDPAMTADITVRDLLAHRSGLPTANLMWLTRETDPDTLLHRLRDLEPIAGFRAAFTYQNLLYLAAGRIAERIGGKSWDRLLTDRLLGPLGMERTGAKLGFLDERDDVATPHVLVGDAATPVPHRQLDHVGPAGSIVSTAADLARWLRFLIGGGAGDGEALIEPTTLSETVTPQMLVPADPVMQAFHPAARVQAYGMGWFITDFHGRTLLAHGGGIDGMSALVAWIPEEELGVALLTNLQPPAAPTWIFGMLYGVLDPVLGVEPTDWRTPAGSLDAMFAELRGGGESPARTPGTSPSLPAAEYAGTYASSTLGQARILAGATSGDSSGSGSGDDRLRFEFGTLAGDLEHWHHDTFRVRWEDVALRAAAGDGWITFDLARAGDVEALELEAIPGETERLERRGE